MFEKEALKSQNTQCVPPLKLASGLSKSAQEWAEKLLMMIDERVAEEPSFETGRSGREQLDAPRLKPGRHLRFSSTSICYALRRPLYLTDSLHMHVHMQAERCPTNGTTKSLRMLLGAAPVRRATSRSSCGTTK